MNDVIAKAIEASREREKKATEGPWTTQEPGLGGIAPVVVTDGVKHAGTFVCECNEAEDGTAEKDARFIAAARTYEPRFREALAVAVVALKCCDGRKAGKMIAEEALAGIAAILAGEKP